MNMTRLCLIVGSLTITLGAVLPLVAHPTLIIPSDRAQKRDITPVDSHQILQGIQQLPVTMWAYKADPSLRPHIGPMAQDFGRTFLGQPEAKTIDIASALGVCLAGIQALAKHIQDSAHTNA